VAITEGRRKRRYDNLEEVLGVDNAEVMMELLPPVGWADVATNRELDHLRVTIEKRLDTRFDAAEHRMLAEVHGLRAEMYRELAAVRGEIGGLRDDVASMMRSLTIWGTGLCTSLAGLAFTAGHLL
jgi:hypothetical protein